MNFSVPEPLCPHCGAQEVSNAKKFSNCFLYTHCGSNPNGGEYAGQSLIGNASMEEHRSCCRWDTDAATTPEETETWNRGGRRYSNATTAAQEANQFCIALD